MAGPTVTLEEFGDRVKMEAELRQKQSLESTDNSSDILRYSS